MAKVKMQVELEYDAGVVHGEDAEAKEWFFGSILDGDKGLLLLHSNEIGDTIGSVIVLSVERSDQ